MNRDGLLELINEWHKKEEHQKIIDVIDALPREKLGYELTCLLVRAYSNNYILAGRFETAAKPIIALLDFGITVRQRPYC